MTTGKLDAAVDFGQPIHADRPSRNLRQWWSAITLMLAAAVFAQAVFAGLMLSGVEWGYAAHEMNAVALIATALLAGLASIVLLRRTANGPKLALTLLALALLIFLQTAVGKSSVAGANLMWLHIPLGVALAGIAARAVAVARSLGGK
jgi:hypothetical protein